MANKAPLIHIASQVFETPLAIQQGKLEVILNAIGPRLGTEALSFDSALELSHCRACGGTGVRFHAAKGGEPCGICNSTGRSKVVAYYDDDEDTYSSEKKKLYTVTDAGVAIIPITGTLMESGGWMSALSGCSSYEGITKAVKMAMDEDNTVKAVLFRVNSPGGSTHGCFELCDLIHGYRGKKPMYSIAKHLAASAGYAIASCADEVHVTLTGAVGSVGVFALHCDQSKLDKDAGLKYTYIHYGAKKVDGNAHAPLSDSATADLQAEVDRQGALFISRVARNRNTTAKKVAATEAGVFYSDGAIPLFADRVSTYDECLSAITARITGTAGSRSGVTILKSQKTTSSNPMPEEEEQCDSEDTDKQTDENCGKKVENEVTTIMADTNNPTPTVATAAVTTPPPTQAALTAPILAPPAQTVAQAALPASPPAPAPVITMPPPAPVAEAPYDYLTVMNLCNLAGHPELAAEYAKEKKPMAAVVAALQVLRASASDDTQVNNGFVSVNSDSINAVVSQTNAIAASAGISRPQAFIRLLAEKPELYEAYENDRQAAMDKRNRAGRQSYLRQVANQCQALQLSRGGY